MYLVDAHHLGARQTGNETWTRNICRELLRVVDPGSVLICVAHEPAAVPAGARTALVSTNALRRLLVDLPAAARSVRAQALLVQYTAPLTSRPCAVMIHDMSPFDRRHAEWLGRAHALRIRASIRDSARRAPVLIVPSRFTQHDLAERLGRDPDSILVAPNAVDPELTELLYGAVPLPPHKTARVLAVGNVLPRKNLAVLGVALDRLRGEGLDAELRIVGQVGAGGHETSAELRRRLGAAVSFSGFVTLERLAMEYRQADLLAFPSLYEGFGIPALEAMYAGLPVVASASTALPEVVGDAGLLVSPDDPNGWAEAIGRVLTDEKLRTGLRAKGAARAQEFSWADSAAVVLEALRRAAGSDPTAMARAA